MRAISTVNACCACCCVCGCACCRACSCTWCCACRCAAAVPVAALLALALVLMLAMAQALAQALVLALALALALEWHGMWSTSLFYASLLCSICTAWARLLVVQAVQGTPIFGGVFIHALHDGVGFLFGRGERGLQVWLHFFFRHEEGACGLAGTVQ